MRRETLSLFGAPSPCLPPRPPLPPQSWRIRPKHDAPLGNMGQGGVPQVDALHVALEQTCFYVCQAQRIVHDRRSRGRGRRFASFRGPPSCVPRRMDHPKSNMPSWRGSRRLILYGISWFRGLPLARGVRARQSCTNTPVWANFERPRLRLGGRSCLPSARCSAFTRVARPCRSVWPPRAPPPSSCFNAALPPMRAAATAVEKAVEKAVETAVEKGVRHIVHQGRAAGNMAEARRRPKHDEGGGARGDDRRRSVMIGVGGGGSERGHAFSIDTPTQHPLTTNCAKRLWY